MKRALLRSLFSTFAPLFFLSLHAQDRFAYAVTDVIQKGSAWSVIRKLDLRTGKFSPVIFNGTAENTTAFDAISKKPMEPNGATNKIMKRPFYAGVAALAYDARYQRLYYTPMFITGLRYIDLKTGKLFLVSDTSSTVWPRRKGEGPVITRMTMAPDGHGYMLSNDGMKFYHFTTGKKPAMTLLGPLTDHPDNKGNSIHDRISYGGDMVADDEGNLLLITAKNHVFQININTQVARHLGIVQHLPENFTVNGVAVNDDGELLLGSAVDTNGWFVVNAQSLEAKPYTAAASVFRCSDLANGNFLSDPKKKKTTAAPAVAAGIIIYPNPVTTHRFQLDLKRMNKGDYAVVVMDLSGRQVMQQKITVRNDWHTQSLHLPNSAARGMYLVRVTGNNGKHLFEQKLMLQ